MSQDRVRAQWMTVYVCQDAGANGYVASLENNSSTKMGIMHAVYGTFPVPTHFCVQTTFLIRLQA